MKPETLTGQSANKQTKWKRRLKRNSFQAQQFQKLNSNNNNMTLDEIIRFPLTPSNDRYGTIEKEVPISMSVMCYECYAMENNTQLMKCFESDDQENLDSGWDQVAIITGTF